MDSTDPPATSRHRTAVRSSRAIVVATLAVIGAGCGSDAEGGPNPTSGVAASAPAVEAAATGTTSDRELAQAALLSPDDLDGNWRTDPPEFLWPNSAELARTAPACVGFADLVFEGGAEHGTGASVGLTTDGGNLMSYVVIFPTAAEAAAMVAAVASPEFDDCWSEFNAVGVMAMPLGVTDASYEKATPPELTFEADYYVTRSVTGTVVIDGTEFGDSCICTFAQVGRGVVEVHSPAEHWDPQERTALTQVAIDKLRDVLG